MLVSVPYEKEDKFGVLYLDNKNVMFGNPESGICLMLRALVSLMSFAAGKIATRLSRWDSNP
jgi:hypothetical protein